MTIKDFLLLKNRVSAKKRFKMVHTIKREINRLDAYELAFKQF